MKRLKEKIIIKINKVKYLPKTVVESISLKMKILIKKRFRKLEITSKADKGSPSNK